MLKTIKNILGWLTTKPDQNVYVRGVQPTKQSYIILPITILDNYDGDTLKARFTIDFTVRLQDCWCPEIDSRDAATRKRAQELKSILSTLIKPNNRAQLEISEFRNLSEVFTFGRIVGKVRQFGESRDLSQIMVEDFGAKHVKN